MITKAKRLAELAAKNAALWDEYGWKRIQWLSEFGWCNPLTNDFRFYALKELRPRQRTITVTIPRPNSYGRNDDTRDGEVFVWYDRAEQSNAAYEAIRAAMKEQDDE